MDLLRKLQDKGIMRVEDSNLGPITTPNIGIPQSLLTQLSNRVIEIILRKRNADRVIGPRNKLLAWEDETLQVPLIEKIGQVTPYSDFGMSRVTAINMNFIKTGNYRFSAKFQVGKLETAQLAKIKVDAYTKKFEAANEALMVEFNNVAFHGHLDSTANSFICYGLFNNPDMPAYQAVGKTWATSTWQEVSDSIAKGVQDLIEQSGGHVTEDSPIKFTLPPVKLAMLKNMRTDLGISVFEMIQASYPNMEFVSAIEMSKAYTGNVDVMYFEAKMPEGGVDVTMEQGYSELSLMGNPVMGDNSMSQTISAGSLGTILYKAIAISRWQGL